LPVLHAVRIRRLRGQPKIVPAVPRGEAAMSREGAQAFPLGQALPEGASVLPALPTRVVRRGLADGLQAGFREAEEVVKGRPGPRQEGRLVVSRVSPSQAPEEAAPAPRAAEEVPAGGLDEERKRDLRSRLDSSRGPSETRGR
jgi:hypothetical protein